MISFTTATIVDFRICLRILFHYERATGAKGDDDDDDDRDSDDGDGEGCMS
jgi:hypothetical protein